MPYFPKDTDFYWDDKVIELKGEFGARGMFVLDYLLCEIYGKNGYYMIWNDVVARKLAGKMGCDVTPGFLTEFVRGCVACSFFNERVFCMFGVLTSAGIQRRYVRMFKSREHIRMIWEYLVLDTTDKVDVTEGILNKLAFKCLGGTGNPVKSTENPDESSGNDTKKSTVEINDSTPQKSAREEVFKPPTLAEVHNFCIQRNLSVGADKFFYECEVIRKWELSPGRPLVDWRGLLLNYEAGEIAARRLYSAGGGAGVAE